jgi:SAM-dependent methyltransferase
VNEASKSVRLYSDVFNRYINDTNLRILDIGAGEDPVTDFALGWDLEQGNAERIDELIGATSWDVVFASHCLEHMTDPHDALKRWFTLVKPNGVLIILVPDEQLYEQGFFPSIFNSDHKATFSMTNSSSRQSKQSIFVPDLISKLEREFDEEIEVEYLAVQDANYDYKLLREAKFAKALFCFSPKLFWRLKPLLDSLEIVPVDQTRSKNVVAQICFILRRNKNNK